VTGGLLDLWAGRSSADPGLHAEALIA